MNAQIIKTQRAFWALYELTEAELSAQPPQALQIIASECGDILTTSQLYSERLAAELVKTACERLLGRDSTV